MDEVLARIQNDLTNVIAMIRAGHQLTEAQRAMIQNNYLLALELHRLVNRDDE